MANIFDEITQREIASIRFEGNKAIAKITVVADYKGRTATASKEFDVTKELAPLLQKLISEAKSEKAIEATRSLLNSLDAGE